MADAMTNTVMIGIIAFLVLMLFLVILYHMLFGNKKSKTMEEAKIQVIEQEEQEPEEQVRTMYTYGEEE
jgi:flagellar basal body-associated protein FliL